MYVWVPRGAKESMYRYYSPKYHNQGYLMLKTLIGASILGYKGLVCMQSVCSTAYRWISLHDLNQHRNVLELLGSS